MKTKEYPAILSLAAIMSFRMLGLFMILPVMSLHSTDIMGANTKLIGIAIGIYGLTQGLFQIPFGMLSDRFGRKPIITVGLLLFALGSIMAALSHSIYGIILGRALQGAGAIGSSILALASDITPEEKRSKAMAFIGLVIGCAFSISMVIGPIIDSLWSLSGIFWATAILAILGLILLYFTVPTPPQILVHNSMKIQEKGIIATLHNSQLLRLDFGIFSLHAILTSLFIAIPIILTKTIQLNETKQVLLYLAILAISFVLMLPFIIFAEKKQQIKRLMIGSIITLGITQLVLLFSYHNLTFFTLFLILFFTAFTLLEAMLPSLISKIAPAFNKGAAMGVYSSSQYLGIFTGGCLGGWVFSHFATEGVLISGTLLAFIWVCVAASMRHPPHIATIFLKNHELKNFHAPDLKEILSHIPGITEVGIMVNEALVCLKIDQHILKKDELQKRLKDSNLLVDIE